VLSDQADECGSDGGRAIVSPASIRTALIGLIGQHREALIAADLAAFSRGYEQAGIVATV
jgi:hypothetical protein